MYKRNVSHIDINLLKTAFLLLPNVRGHRPFQKIKNFREKALAASRRFDF